MTNIFANGTLNIFSDASISKKPNNGYFGCPACIAVARRDNSTLSIIDKNFLLLDNTTNNDSEAKAIYLAVCMAFKWRLRYNRINIFSDSNITVNGLNSWIYNWANNVVDGYMFSSSGQEVANQGTFLKIINMIVNDRIDIRIFHQRGHMNIENPQHLKAARLAIEANGLKVSDNEIINLCNFNNYVDNYSRDTLINNLDKCVSLDFPIQYLLNKDTLKEYKSLIRRD